MQTLLGYQPPHLNVFMEHNWGLQRSNARHMQQPPSKLLPKLSRRKK